MKGLDLCRDFFTNVGLPAIRKGLPESLLFLAAGSTAGSHCYGNDDEVSRDHGWGPGFVIWLNGDAYNRFARPLQLLLDELPREYLGDRWQAQPEHTCKVYDLHIYTEYLVGHTTPPDSAADWLHIPELALFEITHRPVFYDATGQVARHFASFANYPEDVWKKRLSACLAWLWRWGIEYLPRAEQRGDAITAAMDWNRFAEYAMKVGFLLNHSYAPYHKWLYREFLKLPAFASPVDCFLRQGFESFTRKATLAGQIIVEYVQALDGMGYKPEIVREEWRHIPEEARLLYGYAKSIHASIVDPRIQRLNIYTEVLPPPAVPTWGWFAESSNPDQ